jgi:hypothetical protein
MQSRIRNSKPIVIIDAHWLFAGQKIILSIFKGAVDKEQFLYSKNLKGTVNKSGIQNI